MDCLQYRRKLLEDPYRAEEDFVAHEDTCDSCAAYGRQVRSEEVQLRDALHIQPPPELAERIRLTARLDGRNRRERRYAWWFSAAAGVLIAIAAFSSSLVLSVPDRSSATLAQSVLIHLQEEAGHLHDAGPVRVGKVRYLFRQVGAELEQDLGDINFAAICLMRRKTGVHLIVAGKQGPVTILFMPDERTAAPLRVASDRYQGRIVPTGWGSVAVIGEHGEQLDGIAERMRDAVQWHTSGHTQVRS